MDAVLFTPNTPLPPGGAPPMASESGSIPGSAAGSGADFGAIFNSMQPLLGRQDLAAVLFGQTPAIGTLVSVPLGSGMAVITPEGTPPSQDSLMAFARSQGLDDTAIAALWQSPAMPIDVLAPTSPTPIQGIATGPTPPALPPAIDIQIQPGTLPAAAHPSLTGHAQAPAPGAAAIVLGLSVAPTSTPAPQEAQAPTPELDAVAMQSLRAQFLAQSQRFSGRPVGASGQPVEAPTPPSIPVIRQEQGLIDLDLAKDIAFIALGSPENLSSDGTGSGTGSGTATPTLSLAPQDARPGSQDQRTTQGASAPHSTLSGYQLKAEHYQQLADRMGQALAQRLLEQIDRGQWSMKIRLNPAELGQIDVRLEMRQAGLDAHFQAENPLTKELIQQGSGRLKDNLGQSGMTLASLSVSSDAERQSSGNPTPQQEQRRVAPEQQVVKAPSEAIPASMPKNTRSDGWDLLA